MQISLWMLLIFHTQSRCRWYSGLIRNPRGRSGARYLAACSPALPPPPPPCLWTITSRRYVFEHSCCSGRDRACCRSSMCSQTAGGHGQRSLSSPTLPCSQGAHSVSVACEGPGRMRLSSATPAVTWSSPSCRSSPLLFVSSRKLGDIPVLWSRNVFRPKHWRMK